MAAHLERKAPAGLSKRETHDGSVADARRRLSKDDSGDRSHVTTAAPISAMAFLAPSPRCGRFDGVCLAMGVSGFITEPF